MSCTEVSPRVGLVVRIALVVALTALMASYAGASEVHASGWQAGETGAKPGMAQQSDEMDGESELPWLFAVFAITWAAFFAYVFVMSRRQREMQREIDHLKRSLEGRDAAAGNPRHPREGGNPETGRPS
jgi:CcmD family protein